MELLVKLITNPSEMEIKDYSISDLPVRNPSISTVESSFRKSEYSGDPMIPNLYDDEKLPPLIRKKGIS